MKISALYVYPIKALRGIPLKHAELGPQGIKHDRRFMLYTVNQTTGELKKMQLDAFPRCALFEQEIICDDQKKEPLIRVRYHAPPPTKEQEELDAQLSSSSSGTTITTTTETEIEVPLEPDVATLERIDVSLHGSPASLAYRMGERYDAWFSKCFGVPAVLVYIGNGRRAVLGSTLPPKGTGGSSTESAVPPAPWLTFTDVAPLLVTSESSLRDVHSRLDSAKLDDTSDANFMYKFRPNIAVDGEGEDAWAEDFWAELTVGGEGGQQEPIRLLLTGNCGRCTSLNVDYTTGRPAVGEMGNVLKKLMKDRRVDKGSKWTPVFGRYAFIAGAEEKEAAAVSIDIRVGDVVQVTKRSDERTVWDWPL
ncbi:hypothetical protein B0T17DRAFT_588286 [Bombardia bombarda]|uniref:MOSC domain-containing protein n=1 Tax=Bombardia bombarda TaxID=252184 RepID=A0AA39XNR2_9PEZI|nr:hypothetical protein B0T17DRAFT_588286 [Bombardia bombarda]